MRNALKILVVRGTGSASSSSITRRVRMGTGGRVDEAAEPEVGGVAEVVGATVCSE